MISGTGCELGLPDFAKPVNAPAKEASNWTFEKGGVLRVAMTLLGCGQFMNE